MRTLIVDNFIEAQYRDCKDSITTEYQDLYISFESEKLQLVLSTIHASIVASFKAMNERLPTGDYEAHFGAESSRTLMAAIESAEALQKGLKKSKYAFEIESYYQSLINRCNQFLCKSGGSSIPPNMERINLYYTLPIFIYLDSIDIENELRRSTYNLKLIGSGSYANVYSYKDDFYNKKFVLKRAKADLNEKEVKRFKQEFEEMRKLASPYVVEVFKYNDQKSEYIMEYMDCSLYNYIEKNNSTLSCQQRKGICIQIIKAFSYIHSKSLLHRDISPNNILIKIYDDVVVVKVSDFGLVRIQNSDLTSLETEAKGCFNDLNLQFIGFVNYNIVHETYALTRLLYFVMSGKLIPNKIKDTSLKDFVDKGLNHDEKERFQNIEQLKTAFNKLYNL